MKTFVSQWQIKALVVGLALMSTSLQALIELRRNNKTSVFNGTGIPADAGIRDDVRIGGTRHRDQGRNIHDLTVTGTTNLWSNTYIGRLDAADHLKRGNLTVYGEEIVSSQQSPCKQRREGWVPFDVNTECLAIRFCPTGVTGGPSVNHLGAAWVELHYCGTCDETACLNRIDCTNDGPHEIVFINDGLMLLPCKGIQVGACTTFDVGKFLTPNLPALCGVEKHDHCFLQPCMSYNLARNTTLLCLVPNYDGEPVCSSGSNLPLLVMPKLGDDSCNEDDARINSFCEADMEQVTSCPQFVASGHLFYRIISCDVLDVHVTKKANAHDVTPCPPEQVCCNVDEAVCCTPEEVCVDGTCVPII